MKIMVVHGTKNLMNAILFHQKGIVIHYLLKKIVNRLKIQVKRHTIVYGMKML